jgi:hypothetical protein
MRTNYQRQRDPVGVIVAIVAGGLLLAMAALVVSVYLSI